MYQTTLSTSRATYLILDNACPPSEMMGKRLGSA